MATWDTKDYGFGGSAARAFSKSTKDYSGAFDSSKDGAFSRAWRTGFDADGGGSGISSVFESLFDKAKKRDKYRLQGEQEGGGRFGGDRGFGGEWSRGGSGQILDNLGAIYPQQFSPMYLPGQEGEPGTFSKIAGVAAPFANLIPGVGPVVSAGLSAASRTGW